MMIVKAIAFLALCGLAHASLAGTIVSLDAPRKALFAGGEPTIFMRYEAEVAATATILFIPGGDGTLGLREGMTDISGPWPNILMKPLTRLGFNVLYVDNPYPVASSGAPGADRLDRIESVIGYARDKFKTPIVLYGHSNGSVAVIQLANRSEEVRQRIAAVVLSGARPEYELDADVKLPVLIVHHRLDGCDKTPYSSAVRRFEKFRERGMDVKLATIEGGEGSGPPCTAGHHMYFKAYREVVAALRQNFVR